MYYTFYEYTSYYLSHAEYLFLNQNKLAILIDNYILEHLKDNLNINQLSTKFNFHRTTFCNLSKKFYGVGIMQHVRQLRIQKAKQYLSDTDLHIYEIAELVGIPDYNYFTKIFKKEANCTPKEFRENSIKLPL
ncbi:AraC family transcriptional regulator [Ruminococcus sp. AF31-8BH]|nr:AraC family transcriptional regulator [Ruminococcus sp. AF31-8BH]